MPITWIGGEKEKENDDAAAAIFNGTLINGKRERRRGRNRISNFAVPFNTAAAAVTAPKWRSVRIEELLWEQRSHPLRRLAEILLMNFKKRQTERAKEDVLVFN